MSNKGGELMLRAAVMELGDLHELAVEPWIGPYRLRAQLGLLQKLRIRRMGMAASMPAALIPRRLRDTYGIVSEGDIDALVDASGFAFGDLFPIARMRIMASTLRRYRRASKPVILLPQAFGPFANHHARDHARQAVDAANLVYARDSESRSHLAEIGAPMDRVRMTPDFTGSLIGPVPADSEAWAQRVAVVPNVRMTTSTNNVVAPAYVPYLVKVIEIVRDLGLEPIIVVHETDTDRDLAVAISERAGGVRTVLEADPLRLKGMLAASRLVVASRYHAIAGALSSRVPVLASGWSHKYSALLADYDSQDLLVGPNELRTVDAERIGSLVDGDARRHAIARIAAAANRVEDQVRAMWDDVRAELARGHRPR